MAFPAGAAAAVLVDLEVLLLLLPQAAVHTQSAHTAMAVSDRRSRCLIPLSILVTSSVTFFIEQLRISDSTLRSG
ncbi:MAG TPA: hypothetical protein VIX82_13815, partial [Solirubrobacteraceae bacterium]